MVSQATPSGIVQGTVIRAGTNEPIADVQITLTTSGAIPAPATGRGAPQAANRISAVSDAAGHFTIANVPVGRLFLRAQLDGYFAAAVDGITPRTLTIPVTVAADQSVDIRVEMVPGGIISGRVIDRNGKPMQNVTVQPLTVGYADGTITVQPSGVERVTDDRGEYRLYGLAPGEYRIVATPRAIAFRVAQGDGSQQETTIRTLYPDTSVLSDSIPVSVRSGEEQSGIDIRMKATSTFRISGRVVTTLPPGPVLRRTTTDFGAAGSVRSSVAEMAVVPREPDGLGDLILSMQATVKDDNTFEIRNVLPGAYDIVARLPAVDGWGNGNPPGMSLAPVAFGRTSIEVRDRNLENVTVLVHQGVDLKGVVLIDGKPGAAALRIALQSDSIGARENPPVYGPILEQVALYTPAIAQDGTFTIPLVPEAKYRFQVAPGSPQVQSQTIRLNEDVAAARPEQTGLRPLPDAAYVFDIRQSGVSVYDNGIAVGAEPLSPVEVMIRTDAGGLQGTVTGSDQKPVAAATVILIPPVGRRQNPALYKTVRSGVDGRFAFATVPPGTYKVFASQSIQPGAYQNPQFLAKIEERGMTVTVQPGQTITAGVSLLNP